MPERHLIVDRLKLSYEGLFNFDEVYSVITTFFFERSWDWYERHNESAVTPKGKQMRLIFEPWKNISDFHKLTVRIKVHVQDMKEVEIKHGNQTLRVNQGTIKIIFDGFVVSDRKSKWIDMPFKWFIMLIFDKYFFREHYKKAEDWIKSDIEDLHQQIKTYLNTFKYTYRT
ncbi:MAG: hypothetical protein KKA62_04095 [Nanoarchaeota archaeon]|nr:hypothetical protein [Nanoarchaeota archaeon]MBU1643750.1 hypothetical protein [Nanoarchaeota archaeon]MBU1977105.1 hypothetical protein [Nanoarchaeota archaeon]